MLTNENKLIISAIKNDCKEMNKYFIVLDTNIFYQLSIQDQFNDIIKKIKNHKNIFITKRIFKELSSPEKVIDCCKERLSKKISDQLKKNAFIFDINKEYNEFFRVKETNKLNILEFARQIKNKEKEISEKICEEISKLIRFFKESRITKNYFDLKELIEIKNEYEFRIMEGDHILGYKDFNKEISNYSDYIIFKEMIEVSKEKKLDIIYVTEDQKEIKNWKSDIKQDFENASGHNIYFFDFDNDFMQILDIELTEEEKEINRNVSEAINFNSNYMKYIRSLYRNMLNDSAINEFAIINNQLENAKEFYKTLQNQSAYEMLSSYNDSLFKFNKGKK